MLFHDRAIIDGPARITPEGHFVAKARVARANNVQDYMPHELGLPAKADGKPYRIFRPEASIFAKDSLATAVRRPIVIDHPSGDVTDTNRAQLSVGDTGGEILRSGETMVIPITITSKDGVKAVQTTHPEFSWGYGADLDMTPGKFGDDAFDGSITPPIYNHLAMCGRARGGTDLRVTDSLVIIDERPANFRDQETIVKKIMLDGLQVDLSDAAAVEVAIGKLQGSLTDAKTALGTAESTVAAHVVTINAKDAEIVALKQAVTDATVTPTQLRAAGKSYDTLVTDAKRLVPTLAVTDAMDEGAIRKAAVTAKLGDAVKNFTDAQFETAFATSVALLGDAKGDPLRDAITGGPVNVGDAATRETTARAQANDHNAWRNADTKAA